MNKSRFVYAIAQLFLVLTMIQSTSALWWYLGLQSRLLKSDGKSMSNTNSNSSNLFDLNRSKWSNLRGKLDLRKLCRNERIFTTTAQRNICLRNDKVVTIMARAAKLAIDECQSQFKFKRWNCSIYDRMNVFGNIINTRSRESAFIYAINSAAAMYEVTKACSRGDLKSCSCNKNTENSRKEKRDQRFERFKWAGCSDNVIFGHKLTKQFVDSNEQIDSSLFSLNNIKRRSEFLDKENKLMNMHNNEVGRRVILKNMKQVCKCHGVSGSCSVKVCWKVMPEFRVIGDELMKRYRQAAQINDRRVRSRLQKLKMIISRRSLNFDEQNEQRSMKDSLVFIDTSPNFCKRNSNLNNFGTSGRVCSLVPDSDKKKKQHEQTSRNMNSFFYLKQKRFNQEDRIQTCEYLCCGRGYYSKVVEIEEECDCQFQWCCSVKCKKCKKKVIQYYCN